MFIANFMCIYISQRIIPQARKFHSLLTGFTISLGTLGIIEFFTVRTQTDLI